MADSWTMRHYREGDEESIARLYEKVFGIEMPLSKWAWRYLENGIDIKLIRLAESAAGDIVGQYALCPVRMRFGEREIIGSLSLDTMVHPEWRGRGIFVELARAVYQDAKEEGVPLTYGFPNANSHHGFITRLQWMDLCRTLPVLVKPLDIKRLAQTKFENQGTARLVDWLASAGYRLYSLGSSKAADYPSYDVRSVECFDDATDTLWDRCGGIARISLVRDSAFLNWRFVRNPTEEYHILQAWQHKEVAGYVVLKLADDFGLRVGYVADLLTLPDDDAIAHALMEAALEYFRVKDMDIAGCLMVGNLPWPKQLRKLGFFKVPARLLPQDIYLGVRNNTGEFTDSLLSDWHNWNVSWADHDRV